MKIAYFDCFAGISGDMVLGALVDAGLPLTTLQTELAKLKVDGIALESEKVMKKSFSGTKIHVKTTEGHIHRGLADITAIIDNSELNDEIKRLSKDAFTRLAHAEAAIHNKEINEIHFHEVGALDAIVDIVGAMIGVHSLGIEAVYASRVHLGTGFVKAAHGEIPIPAPATVSLLKGVPVYSTGIESELTTPTGAAILTTLAKGFGAIPQMTVEQIGYGAGTRDLPIANMLRLFIGETDSAGYERDTVVQLETNLDNMNPEHLEYVTDLLREQGALDVYLTPIIMKKSRPATILSVLTSPESADQMLEIIFTETTTLGVRIQDIQRRKLTREMIKIQSVYGEVTIKVGKHGDQIKNIAPEHEECKNIAADRNLPLKDVYDEIKRAANEALANK